MRSNWVSGLDQFDKLATIIILAVKHGTSLLGKQGAQRRKSAFSIVDITLHWTCGYRCNSAQDPNTCWMLRHCRLWDAVRLSLSAVLIPCQDSRRFLPGTGLSDVAFFFACAKDRIYGVTFAKDRTVWRHLLSKTSDTFFCQELHFLDVTFLRRIVLSDAGFCRGLGFLRSLFCQRLEFLTSLFFLFFCQGCCYLTLVFAGDGTFCRRCFVPRTILWDWSRFVGLVTGWRPFSQGLEHGLSYGLSDFALCQGLHGLSDLALIHLGFTMRSY